MYVTNHGGKCCGVKHIHSLGNSPADWFTERKRALVTSGIGAGNEMSAGRNWWNGVAPKETGLARLTRILDHITECKTGHMVEVVLLGYQKKAWHDELVKLGFVLVNPEGKGCKNSNTSFALYMYVKFIGLDEGFGRY